MGGNDQDGAHLYDLFPDGSVTKIPDYVSSGSGSVFAYGVLESHWNPNLTIEEGKKLATLAVNVALQRDSASGNGIEIAVVTREKVEKVLKKELVYSL